MSDDKCGCKTIDRTVMYITRQEIIEAFNYMVSNPNDKFFNLYFSQFGFGRELEIEAQSAKLKKDITDYSI